MRRYVVALGSWLLALGCVHADNCRAKAVVAVQAAAVVTPVIPVTTFQVVVPTYSYQYAPPPQQQYQAQTSPEDCCAQLVAELAKLRAEIAGLRGGVVGQVTPPLSAALVKQNSCEACHTEGKQPQGELVLFLADGKEAPVSLEQKKRAARRLVNRSMPPPEAKFQPTDIERAALVESFK